MPDLTRDLTYGVERLFSFNEVQQLEGTTTQSGCVVEGVTYGEVEVDGYTEKRSLDDGHDATDVYLGRRRVTLRGTVYGRSKGELFDRLREMRYAINPRLAYEEDPDGKGYLPLAYFEPTEEIATFPEGLIHLMLRCRAITGVVTSFDRNQQGGIDSNEMKAPFQVTFEAVDPRVYLREREEISLEGAEGTLDLVNRGGHPAVINLILVIEPHSTRSHEFTINVGGVGLSVTFPPGASMQVIRVDGEKKYVTLQEEDVERMYMGSLDPDSEWPTLPRGDTAATWNIIRDDGVDGALLEQSRLWYRETFS